MEHFCKILFVCEIVSLENVSEIFSTENNCEISHKNFSVLFSIEMDFFFIKMLLKFFIFF